MPFTRESPPLRGNSINSPYKSHAPSSREEGLLFSQQPVVLKSHLFKCNSAWWGHPLYTQMRDRQSRTGRLNIHFPSLFPRAVYRSSVYRCVASRGARIRYACTYLTRHVRANKLYGILCVGVFTPHAEFPERKRLQRGQAALAPLLHLALLLFTTECNVPMRIRVLLVNRWAWRYRERPRVLKSIRGNPMLHVNIIRKTEITKERYRKK